MKRLILFIASCTVLVIILGGVQLSAAVYEASTLHNAVSRSETVVDLFAERWKIIQDQELYVDGYLKLNYVPGFQVNYVNKGTDELEAADMQLVRTYGSLSLLYPVLGGYEGANLAERTAKWTTLPGQEKKKKEGEKEGGMVQPKNLLVGFTMTGFHYGLTSESEVDRGDAGVETVSDYKFEQFFDDVFAVSLLYRPYFFIHAGVVVSNYIEPNDDGTMDYSFDNASKRYFVKSNLLSCLNLNAQTTKGELESYSTGLHINNTLGYLFKAAKHPYVPQLEITYKELKMFQDEAYETMWVGSAFYEINGVKYRKTNAISDDFRETAKLRTLAFSLTQNFGNFIMLKGYAEFQKPNADLVEKRTVDEQKDPDGDTLNFAKTRELRAEIGIDWFRLFNTGQYQRLITTLGVSSYWDPAIPIHRDPVDSEVDDNYRLNGFMFKINYEYTFAGIEIKVARNYSEELRKLVETSDKTMIEASLFMRY